MSDNAADPTVTGSSGAGAVTPELKQELQKIVMGIVKDFVPRAIKQSLESSSDTMLDQLADKLIQSANGDESSGTAAPANGGGDKQQDRLTLKTLQEQIVKLNQGIQERDRKVTEAEQRARETRIRSDVHTQFSRYLGADSPHLAPYVNHFLAQFADHDGQTSRKIKNEYGEDAYMPASQAIDELFKGDLKHLVQPARNGGLVPAALARGQVVQNPQAPRRGFMDEAKAHLAKINPDLAPILAPNDSPQK